MAALVRRRLVEARRLVVRSRAETIQQSLAGIRTRSVGPGRMIAFGRGCPVVLAPVLAERLSRAELRRLALRDRLCRITIPGAIAVLWLGPATGRRTMIHRLPVLEGRRCLGRMILLLLSLLLLPALDLLRGPMMRLGLDALTVVRLRLDPLLRCRAPETCHRGHPSDCVKPAT